MLSKDLSVCFSLTEVHFWGSKLKSQMPHYGILMKAGAFCWRLDLGFPNPFESDGQSPVITGRVEIEHQYWNNTSTSSPSQKKFIGVFPFDLVNNSVGDTIVMFILEVGETEI